MKKMTSVSVIETNGKLQKKLLFSRVSTCIQTLLSLYLNVQKKARFALYNKRKCLHYYIEHTALQKEDYKMT